MLCCQIGNYQPYFDPVTLLISFPNPSYMFATVFSHVCDIVRNDKQYTWYSFFGFPYLGFYFLLLWAGALLLLYFYCWYLSYKSMCKRKCCFFFESGFWSTGSVVRIQGTDSRDKDCVTSSTNHSIVFSYTTKVFESCTAVKELHMEMKPNQIFTILGPNGCGKTTTVSMLTGVYSPTYGDIYVDGVSAVQSPTIIQDNCGVCNQFDYFWPSFTPRQMFTIMGMFKGMGQETIASEYSRLLKLFKIDKFIDANGR